MSNKQNENLWKADQRKQERQARLQSQKTRSGKKKPVKQKIKLGNLILIAILVLAILGLAANTLMQNGYRERHTTAVIVDGEEIPANELNFYASLSGQALGQLFPNGLFAPNAIESLNSPSFSGEEGRTVRDDVINLAKNQLVNDHISLKEAAAEAKLDSAEGERTADELIKNLRNAAAQNGVSLNKLIELQYGPGNNEKTVRQLISNFVQAEAYRKSKLESFKPSPEEAAKIYEEDPSEYDEVSFRIVQLMATEAEMHDFSKGPVFEGTAEEAKKMDLEAYLEQRKQELPAEDEVGELPDETADTETSEEEEKTAEEEQREQELLENAKLRAEEMASKIEKEEDFVSLQGLYCPVDNLKQVIDNPDISLQKGRQGTLTPELAEVIFDEGVVPGDVKVFEAKGSYWVVYIVGSGRNEERAYSARHILFTVNPDASEAQKSEVKARAEEVLNEFKSGEQSAERFAELAEEYSEDPGSKNNGGLYENVKAGEFVPEFEAFALDPNTKPGDVTIVESQHGYHIIYFVGLEEESWVKEIQDNVAREAFREWLEESQDKVEVKEAKGIKYVLPIY
ncbi:MAG: peptidylprolyl isomerase [Eubacteriales bacterium]|nr:peptidylprolyl isomerase [Eubacteriales bacterium]